MTTERLVFKDSEERKRFDQLMNKCEHEESGMHSRLAALLNELYNLHHVDLELITEIEDLYINKGYLYCYISFKQGLTHAK